MVIFIILSRNKACKADSLYVLYCSLVLAWHFSNHLHGISPTIYMAYLQPSTWHISNHRMTYLQVSNFVPNIGVHDAKFPTSLATWDADGSSARNWFTDSPPALIQELSSAITSPSGLFKILIQNYYNPSI